MTAPTTHRACIVGEAACPGEAHCLFRAAGNWAHCSQVLHGKDQQRTAPVERRATQEGVAA